MSEVQQQKKVPPAKVKYDPAARARESSPYPIPHLKEPARLECPQCKEWLPFTEFDSGTDPQCARCRNRAAERELAEVRAQQCRKLSTGLLEGAKGGPSKLARLETFLNELMVNAGGTKVFSQLWWEHFQLAMQQRPGSHSVLDHFRSIAKLVMDVNKLQHQESVADMTDQQLRDKKEMAMLSLLTEAAGDPGKRQMLLELLRSTGMPVQIVPGAIGGPPQEDDDEEGDDGTA